MQRPRADPGGVQGVRTPALLKKKNSVDKYHRECIKTHHFGIRKQKFSAEGACPQLPRPNPPRRSTSVAPFRRTGHPCKILDPPLEAYKAVGVGYFQLLSAFRDELVSRCTSNEQYVSDMWTT